MQMYFSGANCVGQGLWSRIPDRNRNGKNKGRALRNGLQGRATQKKFHPKNFLQMCWRVGEGIAGNFGSKLNLQSLQLIDVLLSLRKT